MKAVKSTEETTPFSWPIIGHESVREILARFFAHDESAHALLFHGPEHVGKNTVAEYYARSILCKSDPISQGPSYPCWKCPTCMAPKASLEGSIIHVQKEADEAQISIDAIRELAKKLSLRSFLPTPRIVFLENVETLSESAANALLKLLEEPPPLTKFILLAATLARVPLTIRSRCHTLFFTPVPAPVLTDALVARGLDPEQAHLFAQVSTGLPGRALGWAEAPDELTHMIDEGQKFLNALGQTLPEQFAFAQTALGKETGQEGRMRALKLLEIWERLLRDAGCYAVGAEELVSFSSLQSTFSNLLSKYSRASVIRMAQGIEDARAAIHTNTSPRFAFEQFFVTHQT